MKGSRLWAIAAVIVASCSSPATTGISPTSSQTFLATTIPASPTSSTPIIPPTQPPTEDELITATGREVPDSIADGRRHCGFLGDQIYLRRTYQYFRQTHPVIAAVVIGDLDGLRQLLDTGGDPNDMDEPFAVSALTAAIQSDCDTAVEMLLDAGADPGISARDDYTPIMWAILRHNHPLLHRLIDLGADVNVTKPQLEETVAIQLATTERDLEAIRILIDAGADLDIVSMGQTPLQSAVAGDWSEGVAVLLESGADPAHTAYYLFGEQDPTLLTVLLDAGADPRWIPDSATSPGGPCPGATDLAECFDAVWPEGAAIVRDYGG